MKRRYLAPLLVIGAITMMGQDDCSSETKNEPDKGGGDGGGDKSKDQKARLGDPITLEGTDTKMRVVVTRVIDPLPAGEFDTPAAGRRFVGVDIALRNVGDKTYDDSPSNGAKLITSGDRQADPTILTGGDCGVEFGSSTTISTGGRQAGCIAFEVKKGARPKAFQFGLDSGFGPQTGEWVLKR